jgi:hypothetical protein
MTWRAFMSLWIYSAFFGLLAIGASELAVKLTRPALPEMPVRVCTFILAVAIAVACGDYVLGRLKKVVHW